MNEPDAPLTFDAIEVEAARLRQTAYLVGTFHRALLDAGCPAGLAEDLVRTWFEDTDELTEPATPAVDDD